MKLETTRFGVCDIEEALIVTFPEGLPGFERFRQFVFVPHPTSAGASPSPFEWLQSVEDGGLAFLTMNPRHFFQDYAPQLPKQDLAALQLEKGGPVPILHVLMTIPTGNPTGITANLLAPVIINPLTRRARQVIVQGDAYGLRHRLLPDG